LARAILEALDSRHDPDALKRRAADFALDAVAENCLHLLFAHESAPAPVAARSENWLCAE
jgi:hypothetical protein